MTARLHIYVTLSSCAQWVDCRVSLIVATRKNPCSWR